MLHIKYSNELTLFTQILTIFRHFGTPFSAFKCNNVKKSRLYFIDTCLFELTTLFWD